MEYFSLVAQDDESAKREVKMEKNLGKERKILAVIGW